MCILKFLPVTTEPVIELQTVPDHNRSETLRKQPEISDILNQVAVKVPDKWQVLGIQLGMSYDQLKTIAAKDQTYQSCYAEILEHWKKNGPLPYTWATIIDILKEPSVDLADLATELNIWVVMNK